MAKMMIGILDSTYYFDGTRTADFENLPYKNYPLSHIPELVKFVKRLDFPNFYICFDTGHCNILGYDIGDMVRLCGDKLKVLHVHDNNGEGDQHLWPYDAYVDWASFQKGLSDIGFSGCLSLETRVSDRCPEDLKETIQICLAKIAGSLACQ